MNSECTFAEINNYVDQLGIRDSMLGFSVVKIWHLLQEQDAILSQPRDFELEIEIVNEINNFRRITFNSTEPITNKTRLLHYLKAYDKYMNSRYKNYISIFKDMNWIFLGSLYERMLRETFSPITAIVSSSNTTIH